MNSSNDNSVPRTKSSRNRPKSGYRVRRPTEPNNNTLTNSFHDTDTTFERQQSSFDSPKSSRSSSDSGVYTGFHEGHPQHQINYSHKHYSRPPSGRPPSRTPASGYGSHDTVPDYDRSSTATPSSSRPSSSSSFSRYAILPNIGQSAANTPEPFLHPVYSTENETYNHNNATEPNEVNTGIYNSTKPSRNFNNQNSKHFNTRDSNFEAEVANMKITSLSKETVGKQTETKSSAETDPEVIYIPTENNTKLLTNEGDKNHKSASDSIDADPIQSMFPPLKRKVILPPEPRDKENSMLLAVKLPNGQRVQRHFKHTDPLLNILQFSEYSSNLDFSGCLLVCDAPPKQVFKDHSVRISDTKLESRTVLHIQVPDD